MGAVAPQVQERLRTLCGLPHACLVPPAAHDLAGKVLSRGQQPLPRPRDPVTVPPTRTGCTRARPWRVRTSDACTLADRQ
eukprot:1407042-Rhodomonas_salina.1